MKEMSDRDAEMYRTLGSMLNRAREAANLTQEEVATELGWSLQAVQKVESGEKRVTIDDFTDLCKAIGCNAYNLLTEWSATIRPLPPQKLRRERLRDGGV